MRSKDARGKSSGVVWKYWGTVVEGPELVVVVCRFSRGEALARLATASIHRKDAMMIATPIITGRTRIVTLGAWRGMKKARGVGREGRYSYLRAR